MKWFIVWMIMGYTLDGIVGPFDSRGDCLQAMTTMVFEAYEADPGLRFHHFYCSQMHTIEEVDK